jgi:hypothetical protein
MGGFPTWRVVSWHDVNQALYNRALVFRKRARKFGWIQPLLDIIIINSSTKIRHSHKNVVFQYKNHFNLKKLQKWTLDGKFQICLSTLSKLTTGNALKLQLINTLAYVRHFDILCINKLCQIGEDAYVYVNYHIKKLNNQQ